MFSSPLSTYEMISDDEPDTCKCNRPMSAHDEKDLGEAPWDMHQNTVEKLDPVHGVLPNGALVCKKIRSILNDFFLGNSLLDLL